RAPLHFRLPRGRDGERPPPHLRDGGAKGPPPCIRRGTSALPYAARLDRRLRRRGLGAGCERKLPAESDALGGGPTHHLRPGLRRAAGAAPARLPARGGTAPRGQPSPRQTSSELSHRAAPPPSRSNAESSVWRIRPWCSMVARSAAEKARHAWLDITKSGSPEPLASARQFPQKLAAWVRVSGRISS